MRRMLRLVLSDGLTTVEVVEYRSIPHLELVLTPLGCKARIGQSLYVILIELAVRSS
ncbi:hypothetical protein BDR04DRAFT_1008390 [Suillus decipiens]|nr:hypothetical protein BDR04DRAFT_1008390 [Suillus decipiens]